MIASACLGALPSGTGAASGPDAPELVWPASGATVNADVPQVFTIGTVDPDGDPYTGTVTVRNASTGNVVFTFTTAPAPSGGHSSGSPGLPFAPGSYTWTASASDIHGNSSPAAPSQPFTIAGASDAGGGAMNGSMSFTQPIPAAVNTSSPLTTPACTPTRFSLSGVSAASVISLAQTAFAGPVTLTGSGGSPCETAALGTGALQLSAEGLGVATSMLDCSALAGTYTRSVTDLNAVVSGSCTINSRSESVTLDVRVQLLPANGGGAAQPITAADFDGAFVVSPAT